MTDKILQNDFSIKQNWSELKSIDLGQADQLILSYMNASKWVGVQPIPHDIGQVICYEINQGEISVVVNLIKYVVEAKTRNLTAVKKNINLEESIAASIDETILNYVMELADTDFEPYDRATKLSDIYTLAPGATDLTEKEDENFGRDRLVHLINWHIKQIKKQVKMENVHSMLDDIPKNEHAWVIVPPADYAMLLTYVDIEVDQDGTPLLNNRVRLYASDALQDEILIGFKENEYNAGLIYAPYRIAIKTVITDPNTLNLVETFKTRDGRLSHPYASTFFRRIKLVGEYNA